MAGIDFLYSLKWQDWATAAGLVFGVVTLAAYIDQRRSSKQNQVLIEFAKRHVNKDIAEDDLKTLGEKRTLIESQISDHLPRLARKAVLQEQSEIHAAAIAEHFAKWKSITEELGAATQGGSLDPLIEAAVREKILPQLEPRRRKESLQVQVSIYSVSLAIVGAVVPYPLGQMLLIGLAVPLAVTMIRLARLERTLSRQSVGP